MNIYKITLDDGTVTHAAALTIEGVIYGTNSGWRAQIKSIEKMRTSLSRSDCEYHEIPMSIAPPNL